jgi:hypothetical protein
MSPTVSLVVVVGYKTICTPNSALIFILCIEDGHRQQAGCPQGDVDFFNLDLFRKL